MSENTNKTIHTEDMQDIIFTPPPWILKWGISVLFTVLLSVITLSALVRYPDMVKAPLQIYALNSPKSVVTKVSGKIVKILVNDNQFVEKGTPLAYMESTAVHEDVLRLLSNLKALQTEDSRFIRWKQQDGLKLGGIQSAFKDFNQSYLNYKSSILAGFYIKKRALLLVDLSNIKSQRSQLLQQKLLQERDYALAKDEYTMHQKLAEQKVEAAMELKREESKYLSRKFPLQQMENELINNKSTFTSKEKEILELDNLIAEEKMKFRQSISSLISEVETWKNEYVLSAPQSGKIVYAGPIQENQFVLANRELFHINPGEDRFFGNINVPQYNMSKIKVGQTVLIKVKSYPYEEYGMIKGNVAELAEIPLNDSVFTARVNLGGGISESGKKFKLKSGMSADAEIITENATLTTRLLRSVTKMLR
jgi:multidrug efflux pump subunit AcrA (membrane-fusion protein)